VEQLGATFGGISSIMLALRAESIAQASRCWMLAFLEGDIAPLSEPQIFLAQAEFIPHVGLE